MPESRVSPESQRPRTEGSVIDPDPQPERGNQSAVVTVGRRPSGGSGNSIVARGSLLAVTAIVFGVFAIATPHVFTSASGLKVMLASESVILIMSIGVTLTLRLGDLDLSFGAVMNFCGAIAAVLTVQRHMPVPVALLVAVITGMLIGLVNAVMVVFLKMNSFIATLGMQTVLTGLTYGITKSTVIVGLPDAIIKFSTASFLGLDAQVWIAWIIAALVWFVYEYTTFGRYLLFIGGNPQAAELAGVRTKLVRATAYVASGGLFALAGIILLGSAGSADPSVGLQYLLPPLAAAFLGTTAIQLGRFNVVGTLIGAYLLLIISTGLQLLGISTWVAQIFNGGALIVAVGFARISLGKSRAAA